MNIVNFFCLSFPFCHITQSVWRIFQERRSGARIPATGARQHGLSVSGERIASNQRAAKTLSYVLVFGLCQFNLLLDHVREQSEPPPNHLGCQGLGLSSEPQKRARSGANPLRFEDLVRAMSNPSEHPSAEPRPSTSSGGQKPTFAMEELTTVLENLRAQQEQSQNTHDNRLQEESFRDRFMKEWNSEDIGFFDLELEGLGSVATSGKLLCVPRCLCVCGQIKRND